METIKNKHRCRPLQNQVTKYGAINYYTCSWQYTVETNLNLSLNSPEKSLNPQRIITEIS